MRTETKVYFQGRDAMFRSRMTRDFKDEPPLVTVWAYHPSDGTLIMEFTPEQAEACAAALLSGVAEADRSLKLSAAAADRLNRLAAREAA